MRNTTNNKFVYFITGASGVGKTTLLELLEEKYKEREDIAFLKFDSIGVPSVEEQIRQYSSPPEWQRATTKLWISKILHETEKPIVIFEGQVNLDFIYQTFREEGFSNFVVILIDCAEEEMERRLKEERKQVELVNQHMRNWRKFLRQQAENLHAQIIDTTHKTRESTVEAFTKIFQAQ
jgi:thymidylate kinase